MRSDVERAERRARQYWYDDGLTEIGGGCLLLAIGALFLAEALLPEGILPANFSAIGIVLLVAGGIWIVNWAVKAAKARITYPRTGYVRYQRRTRTPQRKLITVVVAIVIATLANLILFATAPASLDWTPALQGVFIGLFILYIAYSVGLVRFYLLALFSFILGPAVAVAGLGSSLGNGIYFTGMGLAFLLSGVISLINYLRATQAPEGE